MEAAQSAHGSCSEKGIYLSQRSRNEGFLEEGMPELKSGESRDVS